MSAQYKLLHPTKYYRDYITQGVRPDGRMFDESRPIILNMDCINTADGSALAKIGNTFVVCGVKAELCQPKQEPSDQGFLIPNIELPPLCSARFKPGPPSEQAQVATQFIDDVIRDSQCIDLKDLCICKDKLVWCLYVDIVCLNYEGSVVDCCLIALTAALKTVSLPHVEYDPLMDTKTVVSDRRKKLTVTNVPISSSFIMFDENVLIVDPDCDEEDLSTCQISVVGNGKGLCAVYKQGGSSVTEDVLLKCISINNNRVSEVHKLICETLRTLDEKMQIEKNK